MKLFLAVLFFGLGAWFCIDAFDSPLMESKESAGKAASAMLSAANDKEFLQKAEAFDALLNRLDPTTGDRPETRQKKKAVMQSFDANRTKGGLTAIDGRSRQEFIETAFREDLSSSQKDLQARLETVAYRFGLLSLGFLVILGLFQWLEFRLSRDLEKFYPGLKGNFYGRFRQFYRRAYSEKREKEALELQTVDLERQIRALKKRNQAWSNGAFSVPEALPNRLRTSQQIQPVLPPTESFPPMIIPADPEKSNPPEETSLPPVQAEITPMVVEAVADEIPAVTVDATPTGEEEPRRKVKLVRREPAVIHESTPLIPQIGDGLNAADFEREIRQLEESVSQQVKADAPKAEMKPSSTLLDRLLDFEFTVQQVESPMPSDLERKKDLFSRSRRIISVDIQPDDLAFYQAQYGEGIRDAIMRFLIDCLRKQNVSPSHLAFEAGSLFWQVSDSDVAISEWEEYAMDGYLSERFVFNGHVIDELPKLVFREAEV